MHYREKIVLLIFILVCNLILGAQIIFAGEVKGGLGITGGLGAGLEAAGSEGGLVKPESYFDPQNKAVNVNFENYPGLIFGGYLTLLYPAMAVIYIILVVYGGIIWMVSKGQPEGLKRARGMIIHSSIGLAIGYLSVTVMNYVLNIAFFATNKV